MTSPDSEQIPGQMTVDEVIAEVEKQKKDGKTASKPKPSTRPAHRLMTAAEVVAARRKGWTE